MTGAPTALHTSTAPNTGAPRYALHAPDNAGDVVPWMPEELAKEKFDVEEWREIAPSRATWRTLREVLFPLATDMKMIALVLARCKAANPPIDPMQKPFHIVPVWDSSRRQMVDTIWPAITWYRIQAHRTGAYGGLSEPIMGPTVTRTFAIEATKYDQASEVTVTFPESATLTCYRLVNGVRCPFPATVWWMEAVASMKGGAPNAMWRKRPFGQLLKCAEAAALRAAFPEVGGEPTAEEMEGKSIGDDARDITPPGPPPSPVKRLDKLKTALEQDQTGAAPADPQTTQIAAPQVVAMFEGAAKAAQKEPEAKQPPPAPPEEPADYEYLTLRFDIGDGTTHSERLNTAGAFFRAYWAQCKAITDRIDTTDRIKADLMRLVELNAKEVSQANERSPTAAASFQAKIARVWAELQPAQGRAPAPRDVTMAG